VTLLDRATRLVPEPAVPAARKWFYVLNPLVSWRKRRKVDETTDAFVARFFDGRAEYEGYREEFFSGRIVDICREGDAALEVGCGYGRLSGWFADRADDHVAVEPNRDAVGQAADLYPDIEFAAGVADALPFPDDSFDLVTSWIVLSHVQPGHVEAAASELVRVLRDDGVLLACEHTAGQPGTAVWPRSPDEYRELFAPLALTHTGPRGTEPTFEYADRTTSMLFEA
jgi:ubiquinone/menaquinone biosynthesis C-methylase UbiE